METTALIDHPHLETSSLRFRRILAVTDFSDQACAALADAARIAQLYDGELFILHSLVPSPNAVSPDIGLREAIAVSRDYAARKMQETIDRIPALSGIPHATFIEEGYLDEQVETLVKAHHIDLVIAGSRGASGFDKLFFGSAAESLIRKSSCPVMIVGPHAKPVFSFGSILFAADLELGSLRAAQYAVSLARTLQASLTMTHVVNVVGPPPPAEKAALEKKLEELLPRDIAAELSPQINIEHGLAAPRILHQADVSKAELIVMGCRHHGPLADRTTWRTLSKVVQEAECPVLVVKGRLGEDQA